MRFFGAWFARRGLRVRFAGRRAYSKECYLRLKEGLAMGLRSFWNKIKGGTPQPAQDDATAQDSELAIEDTFAHIYAVELFFEVMPDLLPEAALLEALQSQLGNVSCLSNAEDLETPKSVVQFVFPDHQVHFENGDLPSQLCIFKTERPSLSPTPANENYAASFQHSWLFPEAEMRLSSCPHSMLVTDMMSSGLPYHERMDVFQRALYAIVSVLRPDAIHFTVSKQFMDAATFLENVPGAENYDPLMGVFNVRLFRIEDEVHPAVLMDTLGLSALGLPDLQIHCHGLDVNQLAGLLYNTGHYIFEKGDVIEDGNTLGGWELSQRWICQHEVSLVAPHRVVVDIHPGPDYAVGRS
jgi:hypothetical protein